MGMGPIVWACLLLTSHQAPVREEFINSRRFSLPIKLAQEEKRNELKAFVLLVSQDQGTSWLPFDQKPASEKAFIFTTQRDGRYWFIVQQLDKSDRPNPADPTRVKPSMAVIVDTIKPQVQVTAERLPNNQILVRWNITELYPDLHSLLLEYHTDAMKPGDWAPLPAQLALQGQHEINPGDPRHKGEVRVRVRMKDLATNLGEGEFVVPAVTAPATEAPIFGNTLVRSEQTGTPAMLTSQQKPAVNLAAPEGSGLSPNRPAELNPAAPLPIGGLPTPSAPDHLPISSGNAAPAAPLPPVKIVSKREVQIEFEVAKVGPSGLGSANVYVHIENPNSNGFKWQPIPEDGKPTVAKELPITLAPGTDLRGSGPVRGFVTVSLPKEGIVYGFIVLVKSKAGLAPPPPDEKQPPEIRVELDLTAPKAQLIRPKPDANQPNSLALQWSAEDTHLAENPITLEWAEQKDGQWKPIGSGPLPNTGQYVWQLPDNIPTRVYLRLTVRDAAGNEARAQTDQPQLIDLTVPQTKIIGVAPQSAVNH